MIFAEPPATRFDLRFRLARFPVRVHPFFWLTTIGLSLRARRSPLEIAIWVLVVFVSILVHELGHAIAFRAFGVPSHVVLYGFGGLACPEAPLRRAWWRRVIVSASGPGAGFVLAGLVTLALRFAPPIGSEPLAVLVSDLMFVNVAWGLVNLLPIHPLDGGDISLAVAERVDPASGATRSLWLSIVVASAAAIVGFVHYEDVFLLIFFGYLAVMSWQALRARGGSLPVIRWKKAQPRKREMDRRLARHLRVVERERTPEDVNALADKMLDDIAKKAARTREQKKN